jgi:hypothetical protein
VEVDVKVINGNPLESTNQHENVDLADRKHEIQQESHPGNNEEP